jgi:spermidine synthase
MTSQLSTSNRNTIATLIAVSVFFSGMSSMMTEFNLSSISTMILGNANQQWALTIAIMLLAMGVGGFTQKFLDNSKLMLKFMSVELLLSFAGSFAPIAIFASFAYMPDHFVLIHYFSIFTIGFLVGFEVPLAVRIIEFYKPKLSDNLAFVFGSEYLGTFIGAIIFVSLILGYVAFTEASFMISGVNLIVALISFIFFIKVINPKLEKEEQINVKMIYVVILITVISIVFGYMNVNKWEVKIEQKLYADPIVQTFTSPFQRIVLTEHKRTGMHRMYINGNTQWAESDEFIYHDMTVHPIMSLTKNHNNILVLGGGDGLVVRELKKYDDIGNITLVDLDKQMIEFSKTNPIMRKLNKDAFIGVKTITPKAVFAGKTEKYRVEVEKGKFKTVANLSTVFIDANNFLNEVDGKFDVVIIDLPDPSTVELSKLYSKGFYLNLKRRMTDNAMVVIQGTSSFHAKESYLMIGRTLAAAGFHVKPYHQNVPSFGEWGWWFGWKDTKSKDLIDTRLESATIDVETDYIDEATMKASFIFGKNMLTNPTHNDINTWMKPKLVEVYNEEWKDY